MNNRLSVSQIGWFVFLSALVTYLFTLEPTSSFWDCSEFLACAYKLEVGHAPGAPVYMLLGRLFGLLAFGNTEYVALAINALSAVASALTVLLLFHIIRWFVDKLLTPKKSDFNASSLEFISNVAAVIGALTYAFTDSFWFSAVEAEVYATSSFFSALVFWCITRYEQEPKGWAENRWLVLIFFLLGLSVGIHLLNLLAVPSMAMVIYFKHFKFSLPKVLLTVGLSIVLILLFVYGIIPGVAKGAALVDLLFVNTFKLPVYTGVLTFIILLSILILLGFRYFERTKRYLPRLALTLFAFWLLGYSSFAVLVIRSADDPFVDMNNVENVFGLVDYLNREQYGERPLIYGNNFNSPIVNSTKRYTYKLYNQTYFKDELNPNYEFDENTLSFFPRMASMDKRHVDAYHKWVDIKGRSVRVNGSEGPRVIQVPTFGENLEFFLKYQVGHMYLRYFMWNFSGRQNDSQGFGDRYFGNWISGIPVLDNWRLGVSEDIPDQFKDSKARNTYFMIPLIIGLIGFLFHFKHDKRNFWVASLLFLLTGPAIIVYLNEVPITPPRTRLCARWLLLGVCNLDWNWSGRPASIVDEPDQ